MKLSLAYQNPTSEIPLLPLVPVLKKHRKEDRIAFKLRLDPTDVNSAGYEFIVPKIDGSEDVRSALEMQTNFYKVCEGMGATTATDQEKIGFQIFHGQALDQFKCGILSKRDEDRKVIRDAMTKTPAVAHRARVPAVMYQAAAGGNPEVLAQAEIPEVLAVPEETDAAFAQRLLRVPLPAVTIEGIARGIYTLMAYMVPPKALARIKRYLRRKCRKPADMTCRVFYNHLARIAQEELPRLPPWKPGQELSQDEMIDILLFAFPQSWQGEMTRQGYDPHESTPVDLISSSANDSK